MEVCSWKKIELDGGFSSSMFGHILYNVIYIYIPLSPIESVFCSSFAVHRRGFHGWPRDFKILGLGIGNGTGPKSMIVFLCGGQWGLEQLMGACTCSTNPFYHRSFLALLQHALVYRWCPFPQLFGEKRSVARHFLTTQYLKNGEWYTKPACFSLPKNILLDHCSWKRRITFPQKFPRRGAFLGPFSPIRCKIWLVIPDGPIFLRWNHQTGLG